MAGKMTRRPTGLQRGWEASPLASFRREMDQLFSNFFGGSELADAETIFPSLDLSENEKETQVRMDVPGMKPEEIDIQLNRDILIVRGEHSEQTEEKDKGRTFHRIERRHGEFSRTVQLPAEVEQDKIHAELKEGVLTITMPKSEKSKPHKISVKG